MKYLFIISIVFISNNIFGQTNQHSIKEGVYYGGICVDDAICGYWYLKSDNRFHFIQLNGNIITLLGEGSWQLSKNLISLKFEESRLPIKGQQVYEYRTESKMPFDSIFLQVVVRDPAHASIAKSTVIINDRLEYLTDNFGVFSKTLSSDSVLHHIIVSKNTAGYRPMRVPLNSTTNYHHLVITLPPLDSLSCGAVFSNNLLMYTPLKSSILQLKLNDDSNEKKLPIMQLKKVENGLSFLKHHLLKAIENQPLYSSNFNAILLDIKEN